jgi:hypothetical protein
VEEAVAGLTPPAPAAEEGEVGVRVVAHSALPPGGDRC